jgi:putative transcriptional regulator
MTGTRPVCATPTARDLAKAQEAHEAGVFVSRLRRAREDFGLTQAQVAKVLGCSRVTLSYFETWQAHPSVVIALRIAAFYETTVEDLWGDVKGSALYEHPFRGQQHLAPGTEPQS